MNARDQEALEDIVAGIDRALGFPITDFDAFEQTDDLQDALIRCLEVMGETVKRLSPDLREQYSDLPSQCRNWLGFQCCLTKGSAVLRNRAKARLTVIPMSKQRPLLLN